MSESLATGRPTTPTEMEDLTVTRIEVGAIGRNAIVCTCERIEYTENSPMFANNVIGVTDCDWCQWRCDED
jgi:hypothetical protein